MNKEKQVTQYKNQVNTIPMRNWTAEEMNFFFAVLTKLRDEGTKEIVMDKYQLAELAKYAVTHNKRYRDTIKNLVDKIGTLTYLEETKNSYSSMPLFLKFKATWTDNLENMELVLKVNPEFEYILNRWNEGKWTKFMLEEFIQIESTYSKTLFRLLKQWKTVGKREFTLDEFKKLMDIPKSYQNGIINHRIINNSIKDLEPHFKDLKVKTIKANTRGNPVIGYKFTWDPEKTNAWEQDKFNKVPSKKQTYKTHKKKRYRSKNGSIEAKKFAEKAREERFARMIEQRKEEQGQTGEEILEEIRKEEGKDEI